ncbi:MAG TPA: SDR family NAD(P)-dependent oxidoreductase, partial [Acetobacteraceae bacterium]|nr:SDR family NAD(P)-dependent oxidoreductase [Acetobacteraceae bacterium]
ESRLIDVRRAEAVADWIEAAGPLDLVVANAGISGRTREGGPEQADLTRAIFEINLGGVLNTVLPAMALMARQASGRDGIRGRIGAVASIAGFLAAPDAPAYCASKAAVDGWIVATAPEARRQGVLLTSICPGFIRTAMTAGYQLPMPGLMDADRATRIILRGLAAGRIRVVFPWWIGIGARAAGLLPPRTMAALRRH